jgi:hypothetical protein
MPQIHAILNKIDVNRTLQTFSLAVQLPQMQFASKPNRHSITSACAAGKYSIATGATSEDTCAPCAAGKYSIATGATSEDTCAPCAADRFSTAGASACLCPDGQDAVDASAACVPCVVGTYFQKFAIHIIAPEIARYQVRGIYHPLVLLVLWCFVFAVTLASTGPLKLFR